MLKKKDRKVPLRKYLIDLRTKDDTIAGVYEKRHPSHGKRETIKSLMTDEFIKYAFDSRDGLGLSNRDVAYVIGCSAGTVGQYVSAFNRNDLDEALFEDVDYTEDIFGTPIANLNMEGIYEQENVFLLISDIQAGSLLNADGLDFSPADTINNYFANLIERLTETILRRNLKITTLNLMLLGDLVDGWKIFPSQHTLPIREQKKIVVVNILNLIRFIVQNITPSVHIYGVYGNHGSNSRYHVSSDNWDLISMEEIEIHIKHLREYNDQYELIESYISEEEVQLHEIGNFTYLIQHGHQFNGFSTEAWKRQARDLHLSKGGFDALFMGHWHQVNWLDNSGMHMVINGCTYHSDFVANKLQGKETIAQVLIGADEHNAVAWMDRLDVDQGITVSE